MIDVPFSTPVLLRTDLSVEEVLKALRSALPPRFAFLASVNEFPVAGRVTPRSCSLFGHAYGRRRPVRNLKLEFQADGSGTLLRGAFAPSLFTLVGFAMLLAVIAGEAGNAYRDHTKNWQFSLLFMVAVPAVMALNMSLSTGIENRTLEFVQKVLGAYPVV